MFSYLEYENRISFDNFYHVQGRWEGQLISKNDIPKNKNYFIEPFLLIDFSKIYHLRYKEAIKIYYGFRVHYYNFLKSEGYLKYQNKNEQQKIEWSNFKIFDDLYHFSIKEKIILSDLLKFRFQLTLNINNDIKNGCSQVISEKESDQFFHPIKHKLYNFKNLPPTYNFEQPIYLPIKCFKNNEFNKIKLYLNFLNGNNLNDQRFQATEVTFFWSPQKKISFNLQKKNQRDLNIPYWFLITSQRGSLLKITPVNFFQLKVINKILPEYQNIIPFDSLWKIEFQKLKMTLSNFLFFNSFFTWNALKKNFLKLQTWDQNYFFPQFTTRSNYLNFNHQWTGSFIKTSQINSPFNFLQEDLLLLDQETKKWIINFRNFMIEYQHLFFDKSFYDHTLQKIIIDNNQKNTLLSDWKNDSYFLNITTLLSWKNFIGSFEIKILQKTFIINQKYQRIKIKEIESLPKHLFLQDETKYSFPFNILKIILQDQKIIWDLYLQKKITKK